MKFTYCAILIFLTILSSFILYAQEDLYIPQINVTAARVPSELEDTPENITVITKEEIEQMPAKNLGEILKYIPGMIFQENGGPGSPGYPHIQGAEFRHIKVMIDGIPLNSATERLTDLSLFGIESIERVEILKGAGSALWGSALGGVINIITKKPKKSKKGEITLSWAERNTAHFSFKVNSYKKPLGFFLSSSIDHSKGFAPDTEFSSGKFFLSSTISLKEAGKLTVNAGLNQTARGLARFEDWGIRTKERTKRGFGSLSWTVYPKENLEVKTSVWGTILSMKLINEFLTLENPDIVRDLYENRIGTSIQGIITPFNQNIFNLGAEIEKTYIKANDIPNIKDETIGAIFIHDIQNIDNFTLSGGIRWDSSNDFGDQLNPAFGLVYHLRKLKTNLKGTVARGFSLPPLSMKYYEDPQHAPNPDLKPERAWIYQTSINSHPFDFLTISANIFYSEIKDGLAPTILEDGRQKWVNIKKVERKGGELEIMITPFKGFNIIGGGVFNDVVNKETNEVIEGIPRLGYHLGIRYGKDGFMAALYGRYIWYNIEGANDRKFIWDMHLQYRLPYLKNRIDTYINIYNILDESLYWSEYYPNPGRYLEAGIKFRF